MKILTLKKSMLYIFISGMISTSSLCMKINDSQLVKNYFTRIQAGSCLAQAIIIILLKKHNLFFGNKIIPEETASPFCNSTFNMELLINIISLYSLTTCTSIKCILIDEKFNDEMLAFTLLSTTGIIINTLNLNYNRCLKRLKEKSREIRVEVESKIKSLPIDLSNLKCAICLEPPINPINPCIIEDHVFCKICLEDWFTKKHEIKSDQEDDEIKQTFNCLLCLRPITEENPKIKIHRIGEKFFPTAKDLLRESMNIQGFIITICLCILTASLLEALK